MRTRVVMREGLSLKTQLACTHCSAAATREADEPSTLQLGGVMRVGTVALSSSSKEVVE
jgi:hypothetical protein